MIENILLWIVCKYFDLLGKEVIIARFDKDTILMKGNMKKDTDDYFYKRVRDVYMHTLEENK